MPTLRVTGCRVERQAITISFSEAVDQNAASGVSPDPSALAPINYSIFAPAAGLFDQVATAVQPIDSQTVALTGNTFSPGDWVRVTVKGIAPATPVGAPGMANPQAVSGRVPSIEARATRDVEDAISYPILTEEIGYRPSPVGTPAGGGGGSYSGGGGGGSNIGQVAMRAVSDVLGWKPSSTDPKGFVGALTQSFSLTDVEGHVESKWMPRSYTVQTDLGGGISGAQASLYTRAKDALDQSLSLLDGLYPLDPEADPEYVKALREMARSQMTQIVNELGTVGLPSILRIDTYFEILLGQHPTRNFDKVQFDPDKIGGTLGELRSTYGIKFRGNPFNNSIEDEQDITNFRVISDYMTSLLQSWIANREFFVVAPRKIAFFGTQLVLISRQLNVIAETVNEVRFTLDSVFIGPNERQSMLLEFKDGSGLPPMFLEDMLVEIEKFVTDEGPGLLRDGGKISVTNNILPVVKSLQELVSQSHHPENNDELPEGFRTARVRRSLKDLERQLKDLVELVKQVEQQVPTAEDDLVIDGVVLASSTPGSPYSPYLATLSIIGSGIDFGADVEIHSTVMADIIQDERFVSRERIDVDLSIAASDDFPTGDHDVKVRNPDGESATLLGAFHWDGTKITTPSRRGGGGGNGGGNGGRRARGGLSGGVSAAGAQPTPTVPAPVQQPVANAAAGAAPTPPGPATPPVAVTGNDLAAVHDRIDKMHQAQETWFQKMEDKMSDFFEGKSKGKKKKTDDD